jgi:hypothetical protein
MIQIDQLQDSRCSSIAEIGGKVKYTLSLSISFVNQGLQTTSSPNHFTATAS